MNVKTIREAIAYEVNTLVEGTRYGASEALRSFAHHAKDEEIVRFAQLICNVADSSDRMVAPPMDSADLARANVD